MIAASMQSPVAFGQIFDRHADTLLRFLVRRVGPADAQELLAEVFRVAFERRSSFDRERSSARPWLYGIATNVLRQNRRSEVRRLRANVRMAADRQSVQQAEEGAIDARVILPKVAEAIAALPDGERDALLLFALEELGYAEIAGALEIPVGTVRSRINRARAKLRELLPGRSGP